MKVQTKRHDLESINTPQSIYKYKCKVCQQEWKKLPATLCPGVRVFFSRNPQDCPAQYKTLAELEMKGLRPKNEKQPAAAFKSSLRSHLVLLFDETQAISSTTKKKISIIVYLWFYRFAKLWRRSLGTVATIIEWSIVATLAGFSVWSPSAPLVVFVYQHLVEAFFIGGIVLVFSFASVIAIYLPKPSLGAKKDWQTPGWIFSTFIPAISNTLFVLLVVVVLIRPWWCPTAICPSPQRILITHPQGNHDENLEMYFIVVQSTYYVIPGDPAHYTLNNLPMNIGALHTDGKNSTLLYHLIIGLDSLQQGRFGMTIQAVNLLIQQVAPMPHPLNVWDNTSSIQYENENQYRAFYFGQDAGALMPTIYLRFPNGLGYMHLKPRETDQMDIHIDSNVEANIKFSVRVTYRVDNESQLHMLQLSRAIEIMFADQSDWHLYRLQGGQLVASS